MPRLLKALAVWIVVAAAGWSSPDPAAAYSGCPDPSNVFNPALSQYPCTPITISATGTTAAVVATLAAVAGKTTYICGFSMDATATAATAGAATVTGTITGTLNFVMGVGATATNGSATLNRSFAPCIPASAANTTIVLTSFAAGTGGIASVTAWGYQQ